MVATPANQWKSSAKAEGYELEVPSGNTCLVRRPGPELFMSSGVVPNSLLAIVLPLIEKAQEEGKKGDSSPVPIEAFSGLQKAITDDPAKIADMFTMIDNITVACVIEPVVNAVPVAGEDGVVPPRDPDALYVDIVDFEDKVFIMNYAVGGTANLEQFRDGTAAALAAGQAGAEVSLPPV